MKERLLSLDVFRGMTIAGMILVNNPGTWSAVYSPLKHADWHGITPKDYIFPFFLFIVGVAIMLSLGKKVEVDIETKGKIYLKIIRRSVIIFLLGLFLAAFPFYNFEKSQWIDLSQLRIMGVFQRIAICYLIASLIFIHTNWKQQTVIAVTLCLIYWALMTIIPVPGFSVTTIDDKACNLAAYLDRLLLGENHLWKPAKVYDPEGLLSTIHAVSTTLAGVLAGHWLRKKIDHYEKVSSFFFFGVVLLAIGYLWSLVFPLNKSLWTSSYVVYTAGLALCFLGLCNYLIDIKGYKFWVKPFVVFGVNPLVLFVGSGIMAKTLIIIKVTHENGTKISLQKWIFDTIFLPLASPINASLLYAISFILLWLFLMWLLYKKGIYIKV